MQRILVVLMTVFLLTGLRAAAEPRIALIIGNGTYSSIGGLENPVADANLMADTLSGLGFEVMLVTDSSLTEMKRGIAEFGRKLRSAGQEATGLFYYAGHGVQSFGSNYLLPVDTELRDAADLDLVALEASSILRQMYSARNRTNIVILDACRNNPFDSILDFNDNGLAEMKAPTGTFLAYATAPGEVAYDGTGSNSPFTVALAEELRQPGKAIEQVFKQVRVKVLSQTQGAQTPWDTSSLTTDFYFLPETPLSAEEVAELQMWNSVKGTNDALQIMLFLRAYPGSKYESEARSLLSDIVNMEANAEPAAAAPEPPAPPAPVEPDAREQELIAAAQSTGGLAEYEAYLTEYPEGVFAELARVEVMALREKAAVAAAPAEPEPEPEPEAPPQEQQVASLDPADITFDTPMTLGAPEIVGRSIAQLITGNPLFPPVEGLPEDYWANQSCSNCHQWTPDALCTQAQVYLGASAERSLQKQHPYGGTFKQHLSNWAAGGCR